MGRGEKGEGEGGGERRKGRGRRGEGEWNKQRIIKIRSGSFLVYLQVTVNNQL